MGHFAISLPNNQQAEVRWGTIRKKSIFLGLFGNPKLKREEKKGYIIKIESGDKSGSVYRLLKTKEGEWTSEDIEGFKVSTSDGIIAAIKQAIDNYEKRP